MKPSYESKVKKNVKEMRNCVISTLEVLSASLRPLDYDKKEPSDTFIRGGLG